MAFTINLVRNSTKETGVQMPDSQGALRESGVTGQGTLESPASFGGQSYVWMMHGDGNGQVVRFSPASAPLAADAANGHDVPAGMTKAVEARPGEVYSVFNLV